MIENMLNTILVWQKGLEIKNEQLRIRPLAALPEDVLAPSRSRIANTNTSLGRSCVRNSFFYI